MREDTHCEVFFWASGGRPCHGPEVVNYWHAEHRSAAGSLLSSGVFPGWRVIPFLEVSSVELVGEHSAGALGTLVVAFLPISAAASASVEAKAPQGFDFSQALGGGRDLETTIDQLTA